MDYRQSISRFGMGSNAFYMLLMLLERTSQSVGHLI
jgi:hypothetical protein